MVDIAFTPALGEAIEVPISDCCDELDTVAVRFAAALGYREYQQVVEGQLKVQVWSDIASPGAQGGWRAYDFDVAKPVSHDDAVGGVMPATSTAGTRVRLVGPSPASSGGHEPLRSDEISQRLEASIPVSVRNARNFSFTYRVVYPSGDIRWLGTYGHNGYAVVVRESLRGLNLFKGWSEAGRVFSLESQGSPVTIAAFENVEEYDVWSFPRGLSSLESAANDAELLLAIPREFGIYTRNPSYVIHASSGAVMHLDTSAAGSGSIQAHGTGNIMVHACYDLSRLQSLLHLRPLESGGRVELQVVPQEDQRAKCLVVSSSSSSRGKAPIKVVLIPVGQMQAEVEVQLCVEALIGGLSKDVSQVALVAGTASHVQFLKAPFGEQTCTFVVPKHGGEFLLSPVYDFAAPWEGDTLDECRISLLAPHADVTLALEGVVALPTPPPSPQIPLVKKPQVSFAKQAELIPSTPPVSHPQQSNGTHARDLRQRHQASSTRDISPSTSDESSTQSSHADADAPLKKPAARSTSNPFAILYLFVWIRYAIILLRFILTGRTKGWKGKEAVKAIVDVPERRVLQDFSPEKEEEDSAEEPVDDATPEAAAAPISESSGTDSDEDAQEIHAPKPTLPSHTPRGKAIRAIYADLCLPSASPFTSTPASKSKHQASLILSLKEATPPLDGPIPISSLHKVVTINGEVPGDLEVTPLMRDAASDVSTMYLVRFSLPFNVDGGARLRIAETV